MKLVTAEQMRAIDACTIRNIGIPAIVLMENAGRGAFLLIKEYFLDYLERPRIGILCGRGNNGGDGLVVARYLHKEGYHVRVFILGEKAKIKAEAATNLSVAERMSINITEIKDENNLNKEKDYLIGCDLIVDAILGTGLSSEVRGLEAKVIPFLNDVYNGFIASIDIPSGLSSDTGEPLGITVEADLTITFGLEKVGQAVYPGVGYVGNLEIVDISIPSQAIDSVSLNHHLITDEEIKTILRPRPGDLHKGEAGHVLVLAGSPGKTGAATLVCLGTLRSGSGLVTLGIPISLNPILEVKLTEAMTFPLPETSVQTLGLDAWKEVKKSGIKYKVICLGPGLSTHPETKAMVKKIITEANVPLVIDADGINALAGDLDILKKSRSPIILTPHPGEAARVLNISPKDILKEKINLARKISKDYEIIFVLKMARTIIALPDGDIFINSTGNPAMATGGTGDVLTGIIGSFIAQGYDPKEASILAVFFHGLSSDLWVKEHGEIGMTATDLADYLPLAIKDVISNEE
ncbi:MAG: hypothetical protein AMJ45_05655 [Syntrophobacter sp. DG_60]|nr:MAG: hypothetical protein AMJ45_05655 [Syntrophobacter sp. DG_60]